MSKKNNHNQEEYRKIISSTEKDVDRTALPKNVIKIGDQVLHDKNIYIKQPVYKEIHEFTKDKLKVETGGILMGYTIEANGKINIIIDAFIEGKYSEGTPTTLKFTHETWDHVHAEAEKKYPHDKIIGWIHTHPNYGIFLSNYDKFIHQNFFNDNAQIAYVIDPIQITEGFFFWINGQIEKCAGFYIYDDIGTDIEYPEEINSIDSTQLHGNTAVEKNHFKKIFLLLGAFSIIGVIGFCLLSLRISDLHESINTLNEQLLIQNEAIAKSVETVNTNVIALNTQSDMHTVVFLSDDGTILEKRRYSTGDVILLPNDVPVKDDDENYTYTFLGWDKDVAYAYSDVVIQAVFSKALREYEVTFEDENGNVLTSKKYHYGDSISIPEYYPSDVPDDTKQYTVSWDKNITEVFEDTTYKAVIVEVENNEIDKEFDNTNDLDLVENEE